MNSAKYVLPSYAFVFFVGYCFLTMLGRMLYGFWPAI